jgi:hypothetical protein
MANAVHVIRSIYCCCCSVCSKKIALVCPVWSVCSCIALACAYPSAVCVCFGRPVVLATFCVLTPLFVCNVHLAA